MCVGLGLNYRSFNRQAKGSVAELGSAVALSVSCMAASRSLPINTKLKPSFLLFHHNLQNSHHTHTSLWCFPCQKQQHWLLPFCLCRYCPHYVVAQLEGYDTHLMETLFKITLTTNISSFRKNRWVLLNRHTAAKERHKHPF